jgi:hypothetical protein
LSQTLTLDVEQKSRRFARRLSKQHAARKEQILDEGVELFTD